jgi:hypothetical protein
MPDKFPPRMAKDVSEQNPLGRPNAFTRNPTTSFLTATTLIYAIGAGITAAAGRVRTPPSERSELVGASAAGGEC